MTSICQVSYGDQHVIRLVLLLIWCAMDPIYSYPIHVSIYIYIYIYIPAPCIHVSIYIPAPWILWVMNHYDLKNLKQMIYQTSSKTINYVFLLLQPYVSLLELKENLQQHSSLPPVFDPSSSLFEPHLFSELHGMDLAKRADGRTVARFWIQHTCSIVDG